MHKVADFNNQVVGPLLYNPSDAPMYLPGLLANLAMFCAIAVIAA
jgi:hypothetical protein